MTPLMERVILAMQSLGDREVSLKEIREAGKFDGGREVAVCLHYLVNREDMASVREVKGSRERPAVWKLTDLGRMYRPLLTVGPPLAADPAPPPASEPTPTKARRATPKKTEPAGTVADLVTEIKAEQDRGFHDKVLAAARDPRLAQKAEEDAAMARERAHILNDPRLAKHVDEELAKSDAQLAQKGMGPLCEPSASRLSLTLHDDGMLEIEVPSTGFSMLLTPGQTSQLGRFLKGTAGVWERPF